MKKQKYIDKIKESASTGPILIKLGTRHHWVKGIQVGSNEGSRPFPRGDNYEEYTDKNQKSFPEPLGQFSTKLGTKYHWVKEIQVCLNKEQCNFQKEDNGFLAHLS